MQVVSRRTIRSGIRYIPEHRLFSGPRKKTIEPLVGQGGPTVLWDSPPFGKKTDHWILPLQPPLPERFAAIRIRWTVLARDDGWFVTIMAPDQRFLGATSLPYPISSRSVASSSSGPNFFFHNASHVL